MGWTQKVGIGAIGAWAFLMGCQDLEFVAEELRACPGATDRSSVRGEALDAADAAAVFATFDQVSVALDDASSLDLPSSFELSVEGASSEVRALPDCGSDVWFGAWSLAATEGLGDWGNADWADPPARVWSAIDQTTGDSYYVATLHQTWPGGAPLDAWGVAAGDRVGVEISMGLPKDVADGSSVDPGAPHWTLWRTYMPDETDLSEKLASGVATITPTSVP